MKRTENATIFVLLIAAAVLSTMLVFTYQDTQAAAVSVKQGEYIMSPGSYSDATDIVYVTDIAARRMNAYYLDINKNALELIDTVDLETAFK